MEQNAPGHGWWTRIDGYCERMSDAFWAEPVNALSNIAFILAGLLALRAAARAGRVDGPVVFLAVNAMVVGTGSFLFHTFATRWAAVADTTSIGIFILGYFTIAMNRFVGLSWLRAAMAMLGFLFAMVIVSFVLNIMLRPILGGTVSYFPALFGLLAVGWGLSRYGHPAGTGLLQAGAVFAVSLTFRALDEPLCELWPVGTHFLWHLLNGLLLWLLVRTVIRHGKPTERPAAAMA